MKNEFVTALYAIGFMQITVGGHLFLALKLLEYNESLKYSEEGHTDVLDIQELSTVTDNTIFVLKRNKISINSQKSSPWLPLLPVVQAIRVVQSCPAKRSGDCVQ